MFWFPFIILIQAARSLGDASLGQRASFAAKFLELPAEFSSGKSEMDSANSELSSSLGRAFSRMHKELLSFGKIPDSINCRHYFHFHFYLRQERRLFNIYLC